MNLLRSLLCGLLAVLVAMAFAPEGAAHALAHQDASAVTMKAAACTDAAAAMQQDGEHDHAPGAPCQDCCHNGHCHMKAAPPTSAAGLAFAWSSAKFGFGGAPAFADAPDLREPDPERT